MINSSPPFLNSEPSAVMKNHTRGNEFKINKRKTFPLFNYSKQQ